MDDKLKIIYTDIEVMFSIFLSICPLHGEEKIKLFLAAKQSAQKMLFKIANPKEASSLAEGRERDKRMREAWASRKVNQ